MKYSTNNLEPYMIEILLTFSIFLKKFLMIFNSVNKISLKFYQKKSSLPSAYLLAGLRTK